MDDFDHASVVEEQYRALVIAAGTRPLPQKTTDSPTHCANEACGAEIPKARRDAVPGCRFCIECQKRCEERLRQRGYAIHR
ncbi:TraR/DksA C4-type zinc finger protein [Burkholderia sp. lig30]|uniref:TraR/DksA C4-type zinc finger protein n=1 Tax=Burkholderia sp. lig30 TaxID=1192124 RepID=UPI0005723BE4|nr:TraR/DksA C4-type zinc finger protein [Burkholderia sp. lig30]